MSDRAGTCKQACALAAIGLGGLIGGLAGAVLGTIVPLTLYFGSVPPPTRLAAAEQTFLIAAILIALVVGIVVIFGRFVFAGTARQSLLEVKSSTLCRANVN